MRQYTRLNNWLYRQFTANHKPVINYGKREREIDMCKALENLFNKGIEQGVIETKKETVFSLSKMGMPVEQIAQAVKIAVEDVQSWLQESTPQ